MYNIHDRIDLCFAAQLWILSFNEYYNNDTKFELNSVSYITLFIISISFIIIPLIINVFQLNKQIKVWSNDRQSDVHSWIQSRIKLMYILTFICGSSFSMISLCNSHMFRLRIFSMGLSSKQLAVFKNKRIFSIVLLEVK